MAPPPPALPRSVRDYQLCLLTLSYVLGELGHFLIGVTSRDVARDIHYGDRACFGNASASFSSSNIKESIACGAISDEESCRSHDACEWNYTGLGLDYQLLAGPAFIAVFTVSGVVLGAAADAPLLRGRRTQLLGGCVVVFSLATALMGAATRYWHLVLLRMLLAAGEAGCSPLGVSLISDLFPPESRGKASGIFHWGIYFGFAASYALGVYVTQMNVFGLGWRFCYLAAGPPGILVGILLLLQKDVRLTESKNKMYHIEDTDTELKKLNNGELEEVEDKEATVVAGGFNLKEAAKLFCEPIMILLFTGAAFRHTAGFSFAYNARLFFLTYHPETDVGMWLAGAAIVGGATGVLTGGIASDRLLKVLQRRRRQDSGGSSSINQEEAGARARLLVLALSLALASPFAVCVLCLSPPWAFLSLFAYYFFSETWLGILFVAVVELVPQRLKTGVLGVFLFLMNNAGGNLPVLVDPLSKAIGYREALLLFYPAFVLLSGVIFFLASIVLKRTNYKSTSTTA